MGSIENISKSLAMDKTTETYFYKLKKAYYPFNTMFLYEKEC